MAVKNNDLFTLLIYLFYFYILIFSMKKTSFFLVVMIFTGSLFAQQLKSPDEFLGYPLGEKFTPHYKIVSYFQQAAAASPQMMKLEEYGETNEGRPLLLAVIASPENFLHLDEIRKNNLRLTGLLTDKPGDVNAPVIVWLSYNVHGNEPSPGEVGMKVLYELLNPSNTKTKEWLKNTIVIIDPCINPDGHERYVNWLTQMLGKDANVNPDAREHNEPWPGGRTNHYNFDLNRDWAWQTQLETQQRMKKYNEWMPHIHCDFHEQDINVPYYFAPAAEPFHEMITPWQRSFQTVIGKNHAKYFDSNGWLFFTREEFDLFYPAYGDTYPLFNGAIGMTYEQAGNSAAGVAVSQNDGDTLTLKDRIAHHFTTSMSTIEIASLNAQKIVSEFKKYFDDARTNGAGEFKSYISTSSDRKKLQALEKLLNNNHISYGWYTKKNIAKGYNYFTGKEEVIQLEDYSLAIPSNQPKAVLLKVLFEPKSKLSDSVTYDITAWSMPYAYGIKTYACKETAMLDDSLKLMHPLASQKSDYGWIVKYGSIYDASFLAALLNNKVKVHFTENGFEYNDQKYNSGTLIILQKENNDKSILINSLVTKYNEEALPLASGFIDKGFDLGSERVHFIKKPTVVLLTGNGVSSEAAGEFWHLFEQDLGYPITLVNADDASSISWKNIDVLILPNGYYKFLEDKNQNAALKLWVQQGGKIIALENAAAQMSKNDWGFNLKKSDDDSNKNIPATVKLYEDRDRDVLTNSIPGAIYKVTLDNSHPLAFGYPGFYFTLKRNTNVYEYMKDGWNVGTIKTDGPIDGFVGAKTKEKLKDGTLIGVEPIGNGTVIYFADDPLFRGFWKNGELLIANAVFFVGQ